jgi:hypothetical protein
LEEPLLEEPLLEEPLLEEPLLEEPLLNATHSGRHFGFHIHISSVFLSGFQAADRLLPDLGPIKCDLPTKCDLPSLCPKGTKIGCSGSALDGPLLPCLSSPVESRVYWWKAGRRPHAARLNFSGRRDCWAGRFFQLPFLPVEAPPVGAPARVRFNLAGLSTLLACWKAIVAVSRGFAENPGVERAQPSAPQRPPILLA